MNFFQKRISIAGIAFAAIVALLAVGSLTIDTQPTEAAGFGGRTMTVVSTNADPGTQVNVSIELDSQGDEVAASFTLNFDPAILSNPVVTLGSGVPAGANLSLNGNQSAQGRLGVLVDSTNPFLSGPPNRQVISVRFDVAANAPAGATPITFVTSPTPLSVSSAFGALLATAYQVGTVTVAPPAVTFVTIGGRVTTPSGQNLRNAQVSLIDGNGVRRIATTSSFGLYSFANVATAQTYTLTVASKRYRFSPRVEPITAAVSNLDFVGLE